jgi:polyhydroxyalkanoate synthesis regulator phasin
MPQSPDWNKYLDAGAEFVAMTRAQARKRAKELVGTGQLAQEQVQTFVDDLVDESKRRTDVMMDVLRKEIQRQVKTLGIATKEDLARLETRLAKQGAKGASKARSSAKAAAKASAASKTKPKAKKSGTRKASAKKGAKKTAKKTAKNGTRKTAKKATKKTSKASS